MRTNESVPWKPQPLDPLLEGPFERIDEQFREIVIDRLDAMLETLDQMEDELSELLQHEAAYR